MEFNFPFRKSKIFPKATESKKMSPSLSLFLSLSTLSQPLSPPSHLPSSFLPLPSPVSQISKTPIGQNVHFLQLSPYYVSNKDGIS